MRTFAPLRHVGQAFSLTFPGSLRDADFRPGAPGLRDSLDHGERRPAVGGARLRLGAGLEGLEEAVELAAEHERLVGRRRSRSPRAPPRLRQLDLVPAPV